MKMISRNVLILTVACTILAACAITSPETSTGAPEAISRVATGLQVDPQEMIYNAQMLLEEQKFDQAQDSYVRILKVHPENEDAQAGLAFAARLSGDHAEALKQYRQLGKYPSHQTEALEGEGLALLQLRNWDAAERVLLQALERDATLWQAWNALGQVRDQKQKWDDAEISYLRAIALRPQTASVHNNLGVSYLYQLRLDEAVAQFDRSLSLKGGIATVEGNRVVALAMKGDYDGAVQGISWSQRQYGYNNLGFVALLNGDKSRARGFLDKAEEESPRFYPIAAENLKSLQ